MVGLFIEWDMIMATTYTTREGDTLDWLCWQHYGQQSGAVEEVLRVNQNLAEHGVVYPYGVVIVLPDLLTPVAQDTVRLWA